MTKALTACVGFLAMLTAATASAETKTWSSKKWLAGMTYEVGRTHSLGLRLSHVFEHGTAAHGGGLLTWAQVAARPRTVFGRGLAVGGDVMGAFSMLGHTGSTTLELAAGALRGEGETIGVGSAGVFFGLLYFEVGYVFQLGTSRPEWLSKHQFAARIQIPLREYGRKETIEPSTDDEK